MMNRHIIVSCIALIATIPVYANEVLGFRIGATVDEARIAARQLGSELQDMSFGLNSGLEAFAVLPRGPQIWFCKGRLVSVDHTSDSASLHQFVNEFEKNRRLFGEPKSNPYQSFVADMPNSSLRFEWPKPDGVMRTLSIMSLGSGMLMVSSGFFQPNPCW